MGSQAPRIRLAIIEADTPQPQTNAQYGGYGGVFTSLLRLAALSSEPPAPLDSILDISVYHAVGDEAVYPELDSIDAILISGSKHNSFDNDPWILKLVDFTKKCIESDRVRVIGVCFGHQIIGRALGVEVKRSELGWEVAVVDVNLTEKGKELFKLDKMRIHQMHRDVVTANPPGAESLAYTDLCPVQGFYAPKKYITVQGHPEFTGPIVSEVLNVRHKAGIFSDDMFTDAINRANIEHDGVAIARAFLRFLRE
ncbi:putative glutamine amidotransferase-like protein C13C5.04 [Colletotrichum gloeosporioides]|uniref:Putative glutamine amidotransferase-like protein C13C5.04 n=1 Tax=Colletotrichum gloeosporioides TaxID=474922 RepID=A0A8H4C5C6_COLGL|nr:putative glutamine amidotransferase-like protein C13C5.04 [Colletotrichum gloeosporioides]KAI8158177.1 putative glutamine amidotransferase-like protein [Colletotrichum sp. SAR 10_71]KAI8169349.1 putative glutamine amidotransferase-like protein [Colletotrichum sp. SAR 10_70]KAI8177149.1 putative glutamine amidotransferase-like protein [Colletotrichum sp. SAR 10_75]KAI8237819.1 putative glutamine amidotransferase-like protein [Colletotrichum sp. SAR 10_86]KAI8250261.1 putative glutamine amido